MPKVYNIKTDNVPADAVYIGRPSKYGNPFVIGPDGSRAAVIQKYREWLTANPKLTKSVIKELSGKDLVCFCSPKKCHGDVLLEIANPKPTIFD